MHYVRIIKGKIAEFDTGSEHCNILIDDSILGTHFDSWIYKDGKFSKILIDEKFKTNFVKEMEV